ncbi:hypothetical protein DFP73DRAFT_530121 [Morchella snyderi]|nr:hypothetical protein DFP73DRAFT_530121 [Morchella snyderi]
MSERSENSAPAPWGGHTGPKTQARYPNLSPEPHALSARIILIRSKSWGMHQRDGAQSSTFPPASPYPWTSQQHHTAPSPPYTPSSPDMTVTDVCPEADTDEIPAETDIARLVGYCQGPLPLPLGALERSGVSLDPMEVAKALLSADPAARVTATQVLGYPWLLRPQQTLSLGASSIAPNSFDGALYTEDNVARDVADDVAYNVAYDVVYGAADNEEDSEDWRMGSLLGHNLEMVNYR